MADNACFIFFIDGRYGLDAAAQALVRRGFSVRQKSSELVVCFPGKPIFRVSLATDDYVKQEAAELSIATPYSENMSKSDARFEILIDDLDAALEEMNSLIEIEAALQELTHGIVYCTWNGEISGS